MPDMAVLHWRNMCVCVCAYMYVHSCHKSQFCVSSSSQCVWGCNMENLHEMVWYTLVHIQPEHDRHGFFCCSFHLLIGTSSHHLRIVIKICSRVHRQGRIICCWMCVRWPLMRSSQFLFCFAEAQKRLEQQHYALLGVHIMMADRNYFNVSLYIDFKQALHSTLLRKERLVKGNLFPSQWCTAGLCSASLIRMCVQT